MHSTPVEDQRGTTEGPPDNWLDTLLAACQTNVPVLLTGAADAAESVARAIHESSGWRNGPFVVIDCSIDERELEVLLSRWLLRDLTADELDGPTVRRSQDGIVFFREIGQLSPSARAKVAQWLAQVRPCGGPGPRRRVIASSAGPLAVDTVLDDPLNAVEASHIQVDPSRDGDS